MAFLHLAEVKWKKVNGYLLNFKGKILNFQSPPIENGTDWNGNLLVAAKLIVGGVLSVYATFYVMTRLTPKTLINGLFLWRLDFRKRYDLCKPDLLGLEGANYHTVQSTDDVTLGIWNIPSKQNNGSREAMNKNDVVILYLHDRSGTRSDDNRISLYKVLSGAGFWVVTLDYRGFAESSGSPCERGFIDDGIAIYKWILQHHSDARIVIWGHSMGASIAASVVEELMTMNMHPLGVVLEAPFTSLSEYILNHPISIVLNVLPWMSTSLNKFFEGQQIHFKTKLSLQNLTIPILIMHCEDDPIVPYRMGVMLYTVASKHSRGNHVTFKGFKKGFGFGHCDLWRSPELVPNIQTFVERAKGNKEHLV